MAAALALSSRGHRVYVLEGERLPACESPVEAFERWPLRGAPQRRHSHAFLARLHNRIRDGHPDLYAALLAAGAEPLRFTDIARRAFPAHELVPSDDEIVMLACRRITFDWAVHRHLISKEGVDYRDGVRVEGLDAETDAASRLPRVTGVRFRTTTGEIGRLDADLVVDASGRDTRLGQWLTAIGAGALREESEHCGIFYCSRFYRLRDGVRVPPMDGPIAADLGYLKYAIFPGDSRIFSITLAAAPDDAPLRALFREEPFQAAAALLPSTRGWSDPSLSEPITRVYAFARLHDTRRFFVSEDRPLALGVFPIGDALLHSNPIAGRGCSLGWLGAELLADAFAAHGDDPLAFALALDAGVERELVPWHRNVRDQDRAARETARALREGTDPFRFQRDDGSVDPRAWTRSLLRDGLVPALREDLVVLRAFARVFNMLDRPQDLLRNPQLMQRVMAVWQRREQREPRQLGPKREDMLRALAAAES